MPKGKVRLTELELNFICSRLFMALGRVAIELRVAKARSIGSNRMEINLKGFLIPERIHIITVQMTKITTVPMQYRMMNFDIATNICIPTAAIWPARRQMRPKGSKYNDQLMSF